VYRKSEGKKAGENGNSNDKSGNKIEYKVKKGRQ
jgi:hypothetical protein